MRNNWSSMSFDTGSCWKSFHVYFHLRASNVDGSVTSRKANLDIAVIRGEFPEEPLDTWVAQKGEVGCLGTRKVCHFFLKSLSLFPEKFATISCGRWNCPAPLPRATPTLRYRGAETEFHSTWQIRCLTSCQLALNIHTSQKHERVRLKGHGLVISKAEPSDEGRYQCVAKNIAGSRHSHEALLSVYGGYSSLVAWRFIRFSSS